MSATGRWDEVRSRLRHLRRTTALGPLGDALLVRAALRHIDPKARVLAPEELSPYLRLLTPLSPYREVPEDLSFDVIVLRQDTITRFAPSFLATVRRSFACVFANRVFAVFARAGIAAVTADARAVAERLDACLAHGPAPAPRAVRPAASDDRAVLVTTCNRPAGLARSLPQIAALGHAVLVVDDGSDIGLADANAAICLAADARYLRLPANRGLAAAMNVGLSYWLADARVAWISYFQDDVDVDPMLMARMRAVEDATTRPILTGYDADEHPTEREDEIGGLRVLWKRSSPAMHLHAHVAYWRGVLPIPTEYLGAPKPRWEASLDDYWVLNNAPTSVGQRGQLVPCVPGLVRTFLWHPADSTWNNPNLPEPPLESSR